MNPPIVHKFTEDAITGLTLGAKLCTQDGSQTGYTTPAALFALFLANHPISTPDPVTLESLGGAAAADVVQLGGEKQWVTGPKAFIGGLDVASVPANFYSGFVTWDNCSFGLYPGDGTVAVFNSDAAFYGVSGFMGAVACSNDLAVYGQFHAGTSATFDGDATVSGTLWLDGVLASNNYVYLNQGGECNGTFYFNGNTSFGGDIYMTGQVYISGGIINDDAHDLTITNANLQGAILTSPDTTRYRLVVADDGTLGTQAI